MGVQTSMELEPESEKVTLLWSEPGTGGGWGEREKEREFRSYKSRSCTKRPRGEEMMISGPAYFCDT